MKRWTKAVWRAAAVAGALLMVASVGAGPADAVTGVKGTYAAAATFFSPPNTGTISEPLTALPLDLVPHGYVQNEYFAAGTAHAFRATAMPSDGRWTIVPTTAAPYRTRIIVRMPKDPSHFSGTVIVEWMNESGGESAPDWDYLNPELMSAGDAYVAVSAQALGVEGGTPILGSATAGAGQGLVQKDPDRYSTLHHPGDQYALDIFAQIGLALRSPSAHVLGALRPRHIVAVGESQSAFYLTTFADALQPVTHAFDGIFIHSRGGSGAPLSGKSITNQVSSAMRIRTDLDVPVFMFETQTDLTVLGYAPAQQPNTSAIRTWEVAGTSHADAYLVGAALSVLGCTAPVNTGPQHDVVQAAFAAFSMWVVHDTPPPAPRPFSLSTEKPPTLALDRFGNVIGGVRTPAVDVPVSTLSGASPSGANAYCSLFGSTTPFSPQMLTAVYHSKADYLAKYTASLDTAIKDGYILSADRASLLAQAGAVQFPAA